MSGDIDRKRRCRTILTNAQYSPPIRYNRYSRTVGLAAEKRCNAKGRERLLDIKLQIGKCKLKNEN
jgi:hypothetical protein